MQSSPSQLIQPSRNRALMLAGGVMAALAVFMIYWPARENGFVWDDWAVVDRSAGGRDPALWREALLRAPADYAVLFRPFTMLTFLLQLWAGHSEPQPFHVVNLIIHSANVFLLTLIAWRLLNDDTSQALTRPAMAVLCGLIYGVHPALTEPVIWISARSDLVMTFFLCLALLFDRMLPGTGWKRTLAVGACFFAAMLSKETAVGFMLALPIVHLAFNHPPTSTRDLGSLVKALVPHYRVYAALLGTLALYFAARFAVSGLSLGLDEMISPARYIESFGQHVLVVVASLAQHVWGAIWPFQNIVPGRHLPLPINGMDVLPMAVASTGVIVVALVTVCTSSAGRAPALLFLAFIASLLPVANIVPIPAVAAPNEVGVGSRYLTFPLIFACLAAPFVIRLTEASLMKHVRHGGVLLWVIVGAWVLASVANVRVTIPLWRDDVILNSWVIRQGGASFWRYGNLGAHYVLIGDLPRAREAFAAAVKLRDDEHAAWVWDNLGVVEARLGNPARALQAFRRAVELAPENVRSRVHLAMAQRAVGDSKMAVENLEEGLNRIRASGRPDGQEGRLRYELGLAYADLGRPEDAVAQLNVALALARDPQERMAVEGALRSVAPRR